MQDWIQELVQSAEAMGGLAADEDRFRAGFDAFRAQDAESFQRLLGELQVAERCELVCRWLCSKECVLLCLELCGPPREGNLADLRGFAQVVAKITADEELVERLASAVEDRDPEGFRSLVTELEIEPFCHLLCHWVCGLRCQLICRVVCSPQPIPRPHFVEELTRAGAVIATLAANEQAFTEAEKAALSGNCDRLRAVIGQVGLADHCHLVCCFFCYWRCIRFCLLVGRAFPDKVEPSLTEAFGFAQATARLAGQPAVLEQLGQFLDDDDPDGFAAMVQELELGRFAIQLCHWICSWHCWWFCRCVCPPFLPPLWTHVGHFDIYADIDGAGRTNKSLPYFGLWFGGGPNFGFQGCLELRGFCPTTSPSFPGVAMRYRFLYEHPAGTKVPLTGGLLCPVDAASRNIAWPKNVGGIAGGPGTAVQTITVAGAPQPDPVPPLAGNPWYGPAAHVIVPDPDGWITVDPASVSGSFTTLIGFDTTQVVPGGDPDGPAVVAAGTLVPAGNQKNGTDIGIIFEATRVAGPTSPPDFTNQLDTIHINNWFEVNLLDIVQFHTGGGTPCSPLSNALGIEYTVDHELMAAWGVSLETAAAPPPLPGNPVFASGTATRGVPPGPAPAQPPVPVAPPPPWRWADTDNYDISLWPTCSYTVWLGTRAALTTGLWDNQGRTSHKTFCIGARAPKRVPLGERPVA